MKKFFLLLIICGAALLSKAQTVCHDSVYQVTHDTVETFQHTIYFTYPVITSTVNCKYHWWSGTKCKTVYDTAYLTSEYNEPFDSTVKTTHDTTVIKCVTVITQPITQFGAKIQDGNSDEQIAVLNQLGLNIARPTSVDLTTFTGVEKRLDDFINAGIQCIVNVNNQNSNATLAFPKDLALYEKKLRTFLNYYATKLKANKAVVVIENEPTNRNYYFDPIEDYIAELQVAVRVCHEYGVQVADGCTHIEIITSILNGDKHPPKGQADVIKLIAAYKTIPLDYCNLHTRAIGTYPDGQIIAAVNYLRYQTGHQVISNEWHLENAQDGVVSNMVDQWKASGVIYSLIWGGGGQSPADAINIGTTLTTLGEEYKAAVR